MAEIVTGNFNEDRTKYRGWVIGNFVDKASPFHTDDFELKWIKVKKGFTKDSLSRGLFVLSTTSSSPRRSFRRYFNDRHQVAIPSQ